MRTGTGNRLATTLVVICALALVAMGAVMVYSLSPLDQTMRFLSRQLVALALGGAAAFLIARMKRSTLRGLAPWMLAGAVVLLVAVLFLGPERGGARRWLVIDRFNLSFQPSEFAKLAVVLFLAHYCAKWRRLIRDFRYGVLAPAIVLSVVTALIFLEPDWGTSLLIATVGAVMLLIAGLPWYYVCTPASLAAVALGFLLVNGGGVRSERVHSWLHLEETKSARGFQVWQARLALGSGGLDGKGLDRSEYKARIPEVRTDFILAVIGEELGFVGTAGVLTAFALLFICGIGIAWRATDLFGMLLASGVTCTLGLQALINIGVVSGAFPNKGIPLPFISYGGTNLMIMVASLGCLIHVAKSGEDPETEDVASPTLANLPVTRLA